VRREGGRRVRRRGREMVRRRRGREMVRRVRRGSVRRREGGSPHAILFLSLLDLFLELFFFNEFQFLGSLEGLLLVSVEELFLLLVQLMMLLQCLSNAT
jgi:hypothetical protein